MFDAAARPCQLSLFAAPAEGVPAPNYKENLISTGEEADLVARFESLPFVPFAFHGFEGRRRVVSFGWSYDFAAARAHPAAPLPGWLEPLRSRAAAWAGLPAGDLQQASVIEYAPGAPIGWHRDRPIYEDVIGVSLISPRKLRLRRRAGARWDRLSLTLAPRSVYLLRGVARDEWEHSIPAGPDLRYSVMFRSLRGSHPAHTG